jgi:hypothetical protein
MNLRFLHWLFTNPRKLSVQASALGRQLEEVHEQARLSVAAHNAHLALIASRRQDVEQQACESSSRMKWTAFEATMLSRAKALSQMRSMLREDKNVTG